MSSEAIKAPIDGSPLGFWGTHGRFPKADGLPDVELRYRTEPPHGDPLYSLEINGQAVSDEKGIRLFWGRNVILSPCGAYLAVTELLKEGASYSVFNLRDLTEQRHGGHFQLTSLVFPMLTVRPWIMKTPNVSYGEERHIDLKKSGKWKPVSVRQYSDDVQTPWPPW